MVLSHSLVRFQRHEHARPNERHPPPRAGIEPKAATGPGEGGGRGKLVFRPAGSGFTDAAWLWDEEVVWGENGCNRERKTRGWMQRSLSKDAWKAGVAEWRRRGTRLKKQGSL